MTGDTIREAATSLAAQATTLGDARSQGAALGRALVAQAKARELATELASAAAAIEVELTLLHLSGSGDERLAELAAEALRVMRSNSQ